MNASRSVSYKPSYFGQFYKQLSPDEEEKVVDASKQKMEKMRQFSEEVKSKHLPEVDERKRREVEEKLEKESRVMVEREEKEKELIERPRLKGMEYLELVKRLPKRRDHSQVGSSQSERIEYKNYLGSISVDMGRPKEWSTLANKSEHRTEKALVLQI